MNKILIIILIIISNSTFGQNIELKEVIGKYTSEFEYIYDTKLELKEDTSFYLKAIDPLFPYTFQYYVNNGKFKIVEDLLILNPDLPKREKKVNFKQYEDSNLTDSLSIEINYFLEKFQNEEFIEKERFNFNRLTIYINKKRHKYNIIRYYQCSRCAFASKIKNQIIINSSNQVKIEKRDIERIGIYTYGFKEILWFDITSSTLNTFQFLIEQPVDINRVPRSKVLKFKKNQIFFYKRNGKIKKSFPLLLKK